MKNRTILDLLALSPRFLHSVDLARDFKDPKALSDYCLTDFGVLCLARIAEGIQNGSGRRAWRVTGDYGSGKSAFALLLASAVAGERSRLPNKIYHRILQEAPDLLRANYAPLLITGSRMPMGRAVLEKLPNLVSLELGVSSAHKLLRQIRSELKNPNLSDDSVVDLLIQVSSYLARNTCRGGVLIILDEVGKFLEYVALNSESQDISFLQKISEAAARSQEAPLLFVCLLHQGFTAYADQLAQPTQREWEKVAGRLEEIAFNHPLDQVAMLVESALSVKEEAIPRAWRRSMASSMEKAVELGWFGAVSNKRRLVEQAPRIFPIDPFVLPVLLRVFQRFGQNERSLFSFIYSFEPFGLRSYASHKLEGAEPYRLFDFYDYVRSNFGHHLAVVSYRSRWSVIESVVEGFNTDDPIELHVLKTIGILNLINSDDLLPTEERVVWAIGGESETSRQRAEKAISRLRHRGVLHHRGAGRGYCLWPYTSVDIERAYDEASRQVPGVQSVPHSIANILDVRPIVARRHYIETGNLRYFDVSYCAVNELSYNIESLDAKADGHIIIILCENAREYKEAEASAQIQLSNLKRPVLIGVTQPLEHLKAYILEAQRWESVISNTPELNNDPYARDEVIRYRTFAQEALQDVVQSNIGINRLTSETSLAWYFEGKSVRLSSGREILAFLSKLCSEVYSQAPIVKNELVNRHKLSSAAAAARMRLIDLMFTKSHFPFLGMAQERKPPEMSMYLSVLKRTGLHRFSKGKWDLSEPSKADSNRFAPSFRIIRECIEAQPDKRVRVSSLYSELRNPPLGLREGIIPILLAIVMIAREQELALYENGTFLREVGKEVFLRMTKTPENFEIQHCRIEGIRSEVFVKLARLLGVANIRRQNQDLLEVVKRLCLFVAQLPEYSRNTRHLPNITKAVREAILGAREPIRLIFYDLPAACGLKEIVPGVDLDPLLVEQLMKEIRNSLNELRNALPSLYDRMRNAIIQSFGYEDREFPVIRSEIADRAEGLLIDVSEPRLKALCFRLADGGLSESDWLESVGSYIALRPPSKWRDEDESIFERELSTLVTRLKHSEAIVFGKHGRRAAPESLVRISVTRSTGQERQDVISITSDNAERVDALESLISSMISKEGGIALAAVSRALWNYLQMHDGKNEK
ncbi:MAG: hypothetical protein GX465_06015 [Acidobacteria bacterium]|nr:hypothetical protein [Acidobacteriota bacterium]